MKQQQTAVRAALTRNEVAATLGVSLSTVDRLTRAGTLAAIRLSPRRIGYAVTELERHLHGTRAGV